MACKISNMNKINLITWLLFNITLHTYKKVIVHIQQRENTHKFYNRKKKKKKHIVSVDALNNSS